MVMRLGPRERAAVCAGGCALCALACAVAPRDAVAVDFPGRVAGSGPSVAGTVRHDSGPVAIVRDPFVAELRAANAPIRADAAQLSPVPGVPVLPPNNGIGEPLSKGGGVDVRAIVTGARPAAIVGIGDQTLLVRPGDMLDGKRVERIDAAGITLTGNVRLTLAP